MYNRTMEQNIKLAKGLFIQSTIETIELTIPLLPYSKKL